MVVMASAEREPIRGSGGSAPSGGPGRRAPGGGSGGKAPMKLKRFWLFSLQRSHKILTLFGINLCSICSAAGSRMS